MVPASSAERGAASSAGYCWAPFSSARSAGVATAAHAQTASCSKKSLPPVNSVHPGLTSVGIATTAGRNKCRSLLEDLFSLSDEATLSTIRSSRLPVRLNSAAVEHARCHMRTADSMRAPLPSHHRPMSRRTLLKTSGAAAIGAAALMLVGCGGENGEGLRKLREERDAALVALAAAELDLKTVHVREKDFSLTLDKTAVVAGAVRFQVTNGGPSDHELVVLRTDLPAEGLPLVADNSKVDTEAVGITEVVEIPPFAAGGSASQTVRLDPGSYVLICNLPGHYALGMHAPFTVSAA